MSPRTPSLEYNCTSAEKDLTQASTWRAAVAEHGLDSGAPADKDVVDSNREDRVTSRNHRNKQARRNEGALAHWVLMYPTF